MIHILVLSFNMQGTHNPKCLLFLSDDFVRTWGHVLATCLPASQTLWHYALSNSPVKIIFFVSSRKKQGGPQSQGGIFGEFALSNVEGDVTSISYRTTSSSSQHPVPRCCRCRCMSSHGVLNPGSSPRSSHWVPEFSRRRKHFSPAPCSLAYHFGANLKIVDMHARQATSRGVNRGHTRVGKSNWIEESPSSRTCHVCMYASAYVWATGSLPHSRAKCFPMFSAATRPQLF